MKSPDRPRRPFSLDTELWILAVGLFGVAGAALLLNRTEPVAPIEVLAAALILVAVSVVNIAVGLRRSRQAAGALKR
ncbi:MAG: hypothetical protein HOV83_15485 [Catenulispora sp.]|nr:hypothetical protein [Catenulispora sp.]